VSRQSFAEATPFRDGGGFLTPSRTVEPAAMAPRPFMENRGPEMTREEAYSNCPADCYVEFYGHQWLVVPFAPVQQPKFFVCTPGVRVGVTLRGQIGVA